MRATVTVDMTSSCTARGRTFKDVFVHGKDWKKQTKEDL